MSVFDDVQQHPKSHANLGDNQVMGFICCSGDSTKMIYHITCSNCHKTIEMSNDTFYEKLANDALICPHCNCKITMISKSTNN